MKKVGKFIKRFIGSIFLLIYGIIYIVYNIWKWIDRTTPKLFLKAPRWFQQMVIYSMVILSCLCFVGRNDIEFIEVIKEIPVEVSALEETTETEVEKESECSLSGIECSIYYEAKEQGLTDNQAYIVMAISKQETGHWTSAAYKKSNNIGGIMCSKGIKQYESVSDGVADMVAILKKYYFDQGLDTLEKIQPKYCPIGAENDPTGLNNYWLKNTTIFYNEYLERK